jgi:hypothetical protein
MVILVRLIGIIYLKRCGSYNYHLMPCLLFLDGKSSGHFNSNPTDPSSLFVDRIFGLNNSITDILDRYLIMSVKSLQSTRIIVACC